MIRSCCLYFSFILFGLFVGCSTQPSHVKVVTMEAPIYPDYKDVSIPYNIAPLNFLHTEDATSMLVTLYGEKDSLQVSGDNQICFPLARWKEWINEERGHSIRISLQAKVGEDWLQYPDFHWYIVPEPVDAYLTYRLIEPGYEVWNELQICERKVEDFTERVIADNNLTQGSCMNCHFHATNTGGKELSFFHLRGKGGGTVLNQSGKLRKLALKDDKMVSSAVYGDIHPTGTLGVFSSNVIIPAFHAEGTRRLEVYDTVSDLVMADFETGQLIHSPQISDSTHLETFPVFSADGREVFFCSAPAVMLPDSIHSLHYSLCRIGFDTKTKQWGTKVDTLWKATSRKGSACFPKPSPDGRFLLFTIADYGTFPIWHAETDLLLMDLQTGELDSLEVVNANRSDTYHSWSSNSRWFVFASKRDDGQYGKPYFVYLDASGKAHKPFVLPQEDPAYYQFTLKSYNLPDLAPYPVSFTALDIRNLYAKEAEVLTDKCVVEK